MVKSEKRRLLDVSVVIVNYNVRDFLHQSLVSLQKALKGLRAEIIVVDNASDDGSTEFIRNRFPKVRILPQQHNLGFAKANNIALNHVRGKFVLLINPDTVVQEDTIRVMIDFMNSHPEVGLSGCKILNPDGSFQLPCRRSFPTPWVAFTKIFGLSTLFPNKKIFGKYNLTYLSTEETYPVDAVSGSFMFVRRTIIDQVGGLDESFFMYGEDIDWCYRIRQAGWQVYYVPSTQIIHYKGESTRRSSLDEINTFYRAMHLFVGKHFRKSILYGWFLRISISLVSFIAFVSSVLRPLRVAIFDFLSVTLSILLAEEIWKGTFFRYPAYAYPFVFTIPAVIVIGSLYAAGVYTQRRMSVSRSIAATFVAYVFISALTAFFKSYAFSRMIIGISGILSILLVPGWRLLLRMLGKTSAHGRGTLFGRRTVIVGTDSDARLLQKRLRARVGEGYEIMGFVGTTHKDIGKIIDGVSVIGSTENVGKIIKEQRISDVIFAPQALSYAQILTVISRCKDQAVGFHLVPTTMDVIVGKASVDSLNDLPLVQITYNIEKPFHILTKRVFDILCSGLLLVFVYPVFRFSSFIMNSKFDGFISQLPYIFNGSISFVGPPMIKDVREIKDEEDLFYGKFGLYGLVQLQQDRELSQDEINQYNLYYARNQSVLLDVEILIKSWMHYRHKKRV